MTLNEATVKINAILAELETTTSLQVENISVQSIDITHMDSTRTELQRSVVIQLKPIAEIHWTTS